MKNRTTFTAILGLVFSLTVIASSRGSLGQAQNSASTEAQSQTQRKSDIVYVCACLKTRSCSCMTESKMEGPCACGTEGGPPMKAVPRDSDWAKDNRKALAK
jgi:hypothetical protein